MTLSLARPSLRPLLTAVLSTALLSVVLVACGGGGGGSASTPPPPAPSYQITSLVADQATAGATTTDANLVNPWGLAYGPTTRFWLANQGTATATVYDGLGQMLATPLVVSDPIVAGRTVGGPTGMVFNASSGFQGDIFIMASLDGCISGWSTGTAVTRRVDNSASGAIYTGLAQGISTSATYLYAANLAGGTIDVFDAAYAPVTLAAGTLVDPTLPAGYSPYNVQVLAGKLYVTYAQYTAGNPRETPGAGLGIVSVFNLDGTFVQRLATGGSLNAPWGLALAPAGFGPFGGALLVGNFGDGRITAYNVATGALMGQLKGPAGTPISVSGLWGMTFGNDASAGKSTQLYVAAGPQGQIHGLFATISYGTAGTGGGTGGGGY
jgi:uncharacterized protein (TIGR03118 family)